VLARLDFNLYATRFSEIRVWSFFLGGAGVGVWVLFGVFFSFLAGCTEEQKKKLKTLFYS
jgi:hypothetical protein